MKVVFLSNFMNHHQIGLCDELNKLLGDGNFYFIAQSRTFEERSKLGYLEYNSSRNYIVREYESGIERTNEILNECDIVIITFSQGNKPIKIAQRQGKIVIWYDESLFKEYSKIRIFAKILRAKYYFDSEKNDNQYFINASAYGYHDLAILDKNKYKDKSFVFGYFPAFDFNESINFNKIERFSILFVGRLIKLKHPEYIFDCAEALEKNDKDYCIDVVGDGELKFCLQEEINNRGLQDKIHLIGAVRSDEVKKYYQNHDVFLFASDRREGWGAVLSEAMLYGCVPLANNDAGATNVLVKDGVNGFIFNNKQSLKEKCLKLYELKKNSSLASIANNNRKLMLETWNYKEAAKRLYNVMTAIYKKQNPIIYKENDLMGIQTDLK